MLRNHKVTNFLLKITYNIIQVINLTENMSNIKQTIFVQT